MALVYPVLHVFLRFVKFAGVLLRFHFANHLLKYFNGVKTRAALETFHVQFHLTAFSDGDVKFAFGHNI